MTQETGVVKYDTPRGEVALSGRAVRALCPNATPEEVALFVKVCLYHRLNPFLREVYLIKYDRASPASIVVGKDTFTQRAEADPQFDGFTAGVLVTRDSKLLPYEGAYVEEGDTLVGAWASVYRKDRTHPFTTRVSMKEYNRNQSSWRSMPATMIRKVALVQALREAFPRLFVGLYDSAETGESDATEGLGIPIAPAEPEQSVAQEAHMGGAASSTGEASPPPSSVAPDVPVSLSITQPNPKTAGADPGAAPPSIPEYPHAGAFYEMVYRGWNRKVRSQVEAAFAEHKVEFPASWREAALYLIEWWGPPKEEAR